MLHLLRLLGRLKYDFNQESRAHAFLKINSVLETETESLACLLLLLCGIQLQLAALSSCTLRGEELVFNGCPDWIVLE